MIISSKYPFVVGCMFQSYPVLHNFSFSHSWVLIKAWITAMVSSLSKLQSWSCSYIPPLALNSKSTLFKIQRLSPTKAWIAGLCQASCRPLKHTALWFPELKNYSWWTQQFFLCQCSNKGGTTLHLSADSLHWGIVISVNSCINKNRSCS